jgi:hypothetical protein
VKLLAVCHTHASSNLHSFSAGYNATISKALKAEPPSKSAKSNGYRIYQRSLPIYDGRYDVNYQTETTAPPLQLFHPVFGHFLDDIADEGLNIPDETLRAAADFMASASGIYEKEELRQSAILPHLSAALSIGMTKVVNLDRTSPDGAIIVTLTSIPETAPLLLDEQKRDFGDGASDPSIQAGLSMIRCWAQRNVCIRCIVV